MEAIIEGLLYVQGDIGLTIKDIMNMEHWGQKYWDLPEEITREL